LLVPPDLATVVWASTQPSQAQVSDTPVVVVAVFTDLEPKLPPQGPLREPALMVEDKERHIGLRCKQIRLGHRIPVVAVVAVVRLGT
jgi:hypothetical protein